MTPPISLPAPVRSPPVTRFRIGQPVLTPENRVAICCGQVLTPEGLMAFVVDAAPRGQRKSRKVPYDSLRPAPCGRPHMAIDNGNARNPFAPLAAARVDTVAGGEIAVVIRAEPSPKALRGTTRHRAQIYDDGAPIPAFLRGVWARDAQGRKLSAYSPRIALLALLAFRIWPEMAAKRFDVARTIEAARTGALKCGASDQSLLARLASTGTSQ
jgi:hypothetical protein